MAVAILPARVSSTRTVDTSDDFTFVERVYDTFRPGKLDVTSGDIRAPPSSHLEPNLQERS